MSVHGEFQRLVADCIEFLVASSASESDWPTALARADAHVSESLSEAATMVLGLRTGPDALATPRFAADSEAEAFEELAEHLNQICHAIVGR